MLEAEVEGLRLGLCWAQTVGLTHVIFDVDSRRLHEIITEKLEPPWKVRTLCEAIQNLVHSFEHVELNWSCRETNKLADCFADFATTMQSGQTLAPMEVNYNWLANVDTDVSIWYYCPTFASNSFLWGCTSARKLCLY